MSFDLQSYIETYNPHQETVEYLNVKSGTRSNETYAVETVREAARKTAQEHGGRVEFNGTENELIIQPSTNTGKIFR